MYSNDIFRLIIRYSMPNQLSMITTPLKRCATAHIHELDPYRVTVNGYESLLRTPMMLIVIIHIGQLVELPPAR